MASKSIKAADLNLDQLTKQKLPVKIAIGAIIPIAMLLAAYFFMFSDQLDSLKAKQGEEGKLKETYTTKAVQAANLPVLTEELKQLENAFNVLLKQLPTDAEVPNLIQELHQAGANNGMRMNSVIPAQPQTAGPVQVLPYDISVTGTYEQLATFAKDVGQLSRIVVLDSASLGTPDKKSQIVMTAKANTYKALDAAALAASAPKPAAAASAPASAEKK